MSDNAKDSEQQDWTPERLRKYINTGPLDLSSLAREINSCLAAERQRRERAEAGQVCDIVSVMDEAKSLRHQLLSALAAIETAVKCLKEYMAGRGFISDIIELLESINPESLHHRDASTQKTRSVSG